VNRCQVVSPDVIGMLVVYTIRMIERCGSGHVRAVCYAFCYRRLLHCAIAVMSGWLKRRGKSGKTVLLNCRKRVRKVINKVK
jgi:hypothetical protein